MNGSTLAERLEAADLTPAWLARRIGVDKSTVTRWIHADAEIPEQHCDRVEQIVRLIGDLPKR